MMAALLAPAVMVVLLIAADAIVSRETLKSSLRGRAIFFQLVCMLLLVNASGTLAAAVLALFGAFYVVNLLHYGFYRSGLQPELMTAIFNEREDIFLTLGGNLRRNLLFTLLGVAVFWCGWKLQQTFGSGGPWPALALVAIFVLQGVTAKGVHKFKPRKDLSVFENTFRAFQGFLFHSIPAYFSGANIHYVEVGERIEPAPASGRELVVLVIGESVAAQRMSVFGYGADTTPFMREMQAQGRAIFAEGFSSATSTVSATVALLLGLNDPRDINGLRQQNGNLFRLAKQSGFRTHYLSAQRSNVVDRIDMAAVDEMHTLDTDASIHATGERGILARMAALPAGERHFVVVHMRVGHSPYDHYHKVAPSLPVIGGDPNSLENYEYSVRAVDQLLAEMVAIAERRAVPWDIHFTSDHGELFGEEDLFGHAMLSFAVARVPVALLSSDLLTAGTGFLQRATPVSHYDLSCAAAASLGWRIARDGEETGYINGIGYAGSAGLLTYERTRNA